MGSEVQGPDEFVRGGITRTLPGGGEAEFRLLADALPHLVWICSPDGTLDYLNAQGWEYFGAQWADEAGSQGRTRTEGGAPHPFPSDPCTHPEDAARAWAIWGEALRSLTPVNMEVRLRRHDGSHRWHLIRAQPMLDAEGRVSRWMGTSTDIHDVRDANDRAAFLLTLSTELALMRDPQELVCAAMLRLRERLGAPLVTLVELDEATGEAVILRNRGTDGAQIEVTSLPLRPFLELAMRARQGLVTAVRDVRAEGQLACLCDPWFGLDGVGAFVSAPLLQSGSLVAVLSVVEAVPRDWSHSEIELVRRVADVVWPPFEKARADRSVEDALREMNRRKDEFLAMLSHELRNPLAPIRSAVQILRNHDGGAELDWARRVIERQTRHLVRLVDDLLDVSRMVRGQIVLQKDAIDVADVVRHAVETSRPLIRSRKHRLHVQLPAQPLRLQGDLTRLAQVIANLLNNAAKYTDEGGDIWVDARQVRSQVVVRVKDTGAGIAPSLLTHVFELFTQAERTLDRSQGGLGIGLTLVKQLVEMHGGSVEVYSEGLGKGAEFVVKLPALDPYQERVAAPEAVEDPVPATLPNPEPEIPATDRDLDTGATGTLRVLVVDDNVDAADSTAMLLSLDGFDAHSVHSAQAALDAVASLKPDVVLLDIGLPEMDGYDVARRLRELPIGTTPAIIALTGYGQPADRVRAASAGFDEFLVKPVEPDVLNGLLRSLRVSPGRGVGHHR
ncbi:MAG TPA: ATP-binding protein [Steroidobacteraceae bacterium]|jgi:signal transduction histidine kinase/CheY-like chemotaxis protein